MKVMRERSAPTTQRDKAGHRTPPGADLLLITQFLAPEEAQRYFDLLAGDRCVQWRQDHMQLYGRRIALPRLTAWYGEAGLRYAYSGIINEAQSWNGPLRELAQRLEQAADARFNAVL